MKQITTTPKKSASQRCLIAFIAIALAALIPVSAFALEAPAWSGPVNDLAGVLSASEKSELTDYLSAVNSQTGFQIGVLTVTSLEGDSIESFSMRVAEKWKLGSADKDNGAILVVSINDRALRIEVGYGLEETLTDMKSGLIIRNVIIPEFKSGNYGAGIVAGAKSIVGVVTGEVPIAEDTSDTSTESSSDAGGAGVFFIFFLFMILRIASFGRRRGPFERKGGLGGLAGPIILGSALSNLMRNSGGSHKSGGFGGGFGGGGGFSGGGGGFGGGGASGHW
jgi:uncharacterized protein